MPRYFFDLNDGADIRDHTGREFGDPLSVRREAMRVVAGLLEAEGEDSDGCTLILTVRDEQGDTAMTVRMACQVETGAGQHSKRVT